MQTDNRNVWKRFVTGASKNGGGIFQVAETWFDCEQECSQKFLYKGQFLELNWAPILQKKNIFFLKKNYFFPYFFLLRTY